MTFWDLTRWALRQIRTRLLESLLIMLGIGLGVAVICGVIGLTENFQYQQKRQEESGNFRTFQMVPLSENWNSEHAFTLLGGADEEPISLQWEDYQKLRDASLDGLQYVWVANNLSQPMNEGQEQPDFREDYEAYRKWRMDNMLTISLISPEVFQVAELELVKGDLFRDADLIEENPVVVLGHKLAEKLYGQEDPVGKIFQAEHGSFTVIGVVKRDFESDPKTRQFLTGLGGVEELNYYAFIPYTSYHTPWKRELHSLIVRADDQVELATFYTRLNRYLEDTYHGKMTLHGSYMYFEEQKDSSFAVSKLIGIFACAALLIAAINILNLMLARVLRRTKGIGLSAALGASRLDIFKLFLIEALLMGLLGSFLGMGLALGGLKLLSKFLHTEVSLSLLSWVVGVSLALGVSLVIGLYPANQATKISPVDALRAD